MLVQCFCVDVMLSFFWIIIPFSRAVVCDRSIIIGITAFERPKKQMRLYRSEPPEATAM
jgi:hypothetical protein